MAFPNVNHATLRSLLALHPIQDITAYGSNREEAIKKLIIKCSIHPDFVGVRPILPADVYVEDDLSKPRYWQKENWS